MYISSILIHFLLWVTPKFPRNYQIITSKKKSLGPGGGGGGRL